MWAKEPGGCFIKDAKDLFLSLGSGASSGSGSERSPSRQKNVVQQDIKLHQDCDRSSRQRERLTRHTSRDETLQPPQPPPISANNSPFVETKTFLLGFQLPHFKHVLTERKSLSTTDDVKQTTGACSWPKTLFWGIITFLSAVLLKTTCTKSTDGTSAAGQLAYVLAWHSLL